MFCMIVQGLLQRLTIVQLSFPVYKLFKLCELTLSCRTFDVLLQEVAIKVKHTAKSKLPVTYCYILITIDKALFV